MNPFISIQDLKKKLAAKKISPAEVIQFYTNRMKKFAPQLNCLVELFNDATEQKPTYNPEQPLSGIPSVLKDNIVQHGRIGSAGSNILKNYKAPYDATVTNRIKKAGSTIIGRTNMDEFAMGGSGEYSAYGPTKNPWNLKHSPGGSSSGSAAAVAAGLIPFALGTETGGSVRQPAAFCGLVGLYPTYGLHSRYGVMAFASSTDQVGALTQTVYDNALVVSTLSGHCEKDSLSINMPTKDYTKNLDGKFPGNFTVGIIRDSLDEKAIHKDILSAFDLAVKHLEKNGAKIKFIDLPHFKYGVSVYFVLSRAEAASNLARFDGTLYGSRTSHEFKDLHEMYLHTRHDGFGIEVQRRILTGTYVLSSAHKDEYYEQASKVRSIMRTEFQNAFKDVDLLISPTTTTHPFALGGVAEDPFSLYLADYFTVTNCIIGTPAISIPAGYSPDGFPIGIQFLGPRLSEELLYKVAHAFETTADYFQRKGPAGYE